MNPVLQMLESLPENELVHGQPVKEAIARLKFALEIHEKSRQLALQHLGQGGTESYNPEA